MNIKNNENPLVSVIVPICNVEPYIHRCLDSIIGQTLKNIEIICVEDHSDDRSAEILKEYADRDNRIKQSSMRQISVLPRQEKMVWLFLVESILCL